MRMARTARRSAVVAMAALGAVLVLVLAPSAEAQCAMCRQVVTQSAEGQAMAGQLNRAILVMFAAPYLVFGSLAAIVFRGRIGTALKNVSRIATGRG